MPRKSRKRNLSPATLTLASVLGFAILFFVMKMIPQQAPQPETKPQDKPHAEPSATPQDKPHAEPSATPQDKPHAEPPATPQDKPHAEPPVPLDSIVIIGGDTEKQKNERKSYLNKQTGAPVFMFGLQNFADYSLNWSTDKFWNTLSELNPRVIHVTHGSASHMGQAPGDRIIQYMQKHKASWVVPATQWNGQIYPRLGMGTEIEGIWNRMKEVKNYTISVHYKRDDVGILLTAIITHAVGGTLQDQYMIDRFEYSSGSTEYFDFNSPKQGTMKFEPFQSVVYAYDPHKWTAPMI